jgi:hypothetical protein
MVIATFFAVALYPLAAWVQRGDGQGSGQRTRGTVHGKRYVDAGTSPPVWAKSLLTTFQVPSMRASWKKSIKESDPQ